MGRQYSTTQPTRQHQPTNAYFTPAGQATSMKPNYPNDLSDVDLPDHLDLNKADEQILNYLISNIADVPANIAEALDYDRTYIHQRLKRLSEHQIVTNRGNGVYEINRELYDTHYSK